MAILLFAHSSGFVGEPRARNLLPQLCRGELWQLPTMFLQAGSAVILTGLFGVSGRCVLSLPAKHRGGHRYWLEVFKLQLLARL